MRKQAGFTLIELLITVAIILVIAAIAIPNLLRSRLAANEASAVATLNAINSSEVVYTSAYGPGYSANLASLGGACTASTVPSASAACLLDSAVAIDPAVKSGYTFTYTGVGTGIIGSYTVTAVPLSVGTTGQRYFFTDETSVIRGDITAAATVSSSPI
jgi:type IV pilus assembly protein PilA